VKANDELEEKEMLGVSALMMVGGACATAADADLIEFARAAHRASIQSIRQFSCRVECELTMHRTSTVNKWTAVYCRDGDRERAVQTDAKGAVRDFYSDSREFRILEHDKHKREAAGTIQSTTRQTLTECDAYASALLRLPLPNSIGAVPLDQLIEQATRVEDAERRRIDGREHIVLHIDSERPYTVAGKWKVTIYLDASVNYLVRRITLEHPTVLRDYHITEFEEIAPSIFFPATAVYEASQGGKVYGTRKTTFREMVVNQPLPRDALAFRFPLGLLISDQLRGTAYRVDEMGNRISDEQSIGQGGTVGPGSIAPSNNYPEAGVSTDAERRPWTYWLPYFFGTVFLLAAATWCYLRWRGQST
jgi:hypothetical protein